MNNEQLAYGHDFGYDFIIHYIIKDICLFLITDFLNFLILIYSNQLNP